MPLKTFFNLKKKRQREIIDVCLEEFSFNDYNDASLTRIIKRLGVAKGSFYRYFESKRDLYEYLIDYSKGFNIVMFKEIFEEKIDDYNDVLDAWVNFYLAAVKLDNEYPLFSYFGYKVSQERNNVVLGDVAFRTKKVGTDVLRKIFQRQQDKGKIRKDIDLEQMIYTLLQVQIGFLDYIMIKYNMDFKENIKNRKPLFAIPEKRLKEELEGFAKILREGMRR